MNVKENFDELIYAIGKTLHEKRMSSGLTQTDLGKLTGRNQSTIAKIENGPLSNVGVKVIYEIANALALNLSEIIDIAEAKTFHEPNKKNKKSSNSWNKIRRAFENLPREKQKWLENIFLELIQGTQKYN